MAESNASPFSGAATAPPKPTPNRRQKQRKNPKGRKPDWNTWTSSGQSAFPSHFAGALQQAQTSPAFLGQDREAAYVAEIQRCYALMATPAAPEHVLLLRRIRGTKMALRFVFCPRRFYCGLHGWNNSHDSPQCRVMMADEETYPASLRVTTTQVACGHRGQPKSRPTGKL
jgi:hypothetical protein